MNTNAHAVAKKRVALGPRCTLRPLRGPAGKFVLPMIPLPGPTYITEAAARRAMAYGPPMSVQPRGPAKFVVSPLDPLPGPTLLRCGLLLPCDNQTGAEAARSPAMRPLRPRVLVPGSTSFTVAVAGRSLAYGPIPCMRPPRSPANRAMKPEEHVPGSTPFDHGEKR